MKKKERCKPFAENLTAARERKGISRKAFADSLGITQQGLSQYEQGAHEPGLEMLCRMSALLGVAVDDLLGNPSRTRDDVERLAEILKGVVDVRYVDVSDAPGLVVLAPINAQDAKPRSLPAASFLSLMRGMIRENVAPALMAYLRGLARGLQEGRLQIDVLKEKLKQEETAKAKGQKKKAGMNPPGKKG